MTSFKNTWIYGTALAGLLTAALAVGACSSSNSPTPTATTGGSAGSISNTGGSQNQGGSGGTGGKGQAGGTSTGGQGGSGNAGGSGGASCVNAADKNCFSCTPKKTSDFYNQCPTAGCIPFDNSKLTQLSKVPTPPSQ